MAESATEKAARHAAIDELEALVKTYILEEKTRLENERDFLKAVLTGRLGGAYALQVWNVEDTTAFAYDEINYLLGE